MLQWLNGIYIYAIYIFTDSRIFNHLHECHTYIHIIFIYPYIYIYMYNTYACFNYVCIQWLTSEIWGYESSTQWIHGVYIYTSTRFPKKR